MQGYGPLGIPVEIENLRSSISLSHLVVLAALARLLPIKRVLEFGSGEWSTPFFLNKKAFPDLEYLESYETSLEWFDHVLAHVKDDQRVSLAYSGNLIEKIASIDLTKFDLCLIDSEGSTRGQVINTIASRCPYNLIVVIHDYENSNHKVTTSGVREFVVTQVAGPHTCLVWKDERLHSSFCDRLLQEVATI